MFSISIPHAFGFAIARASVRLTHPELDCEVGFPGRTLHPPRLACAMTNVALKDRWRAYQNIINVALEEALPTQEETPEVLWKAMSYSLLGGGKRLRPVLVLMACEACGGSPDQAIPAACAIEMVHTYSLIHDDLPAMDDDDYRRGRLTNHKVYGEAVAILAGDALLTRAFEILANGISPGEIAAGCCADLARAAGAGGMVGGQVLDMQAEASPFPSTPEAAGEQLSAIHRDKTGALIACAASIGARIARAEEATRQSLLEFGQNIGLAFQIADDLLDVVGDQDKMGKAVQKDADRGKLTYPALFGVSASQAMAQRLVDSARQAVRPLGPRGEPLLDLANFVLERDH